jgi:hypothetical protein
MQFKATVHGQDYTEPTLFEAEMRAQKRNRSPLWKASHRHYATMTADGRCSYPTWTPRTKPQPPTPEEAEWLGRWVMMQDGGIAQVWSLAEHRGKVHLGAPGMSGNVLVEDYSTSELREADLGELANAFGEESLF